MRRMNMTNQQSIVEPKCPICGTPATQTEFQELCLRAKNNASDSLATLLETCIRPTALKKFHNNNEGEDPCTHCEYTQITEIPGSFLEMQQETSINSWLEIHICSDCQTKYSVNPKTNSTTKIDR